MFERARIDAGRIDGLLKQYKGRLKFTIDTNPYFTYTRPTINGRESGSVIDLVRELLEALLTLVD
jgi:hypothetical protein